MKRGRIALVALVLLGVAASAEAGSITIAGSDGVGPFGEQDTAYYGQTFQALPGLADQLTFTLNDTGTDSGAATEFRILIAEWEGFNPGTVLFESGDLSVTDGASLTDVTVSLGGIDLADGNTYVALLDAFVLFDGSDSITDLVSASNPYAGGEFVFYNVKDHFGDQNRTSHFDATWNVVAGVDLKMTLTFAECGNSVVEVGEQCDDGDTDTGDGCDATCQVETGYFCTGEPSSCQSCATCPAGEGQTSACTVSTNTVCTACEAGVTYSSVDDNTACQSCSTTCPSGQGQDEPCTLSADRTCTACTGGTDWNDGAYLTCQSCATCPVGAGQTSACTLSTDAVCAACEAGVTYSNVDDNTACQSCAICTYEQSVCSASADAVCDDICDPVPASGCDRPAKSLLKMDTANHRFAWKWIKGSSNKADFADPTDPNAVAPIMKTCVWDGSVLLMSALVGPGGTCDGKPCWRETPKGYSYKNKAGNDDGITKMKVNEGSGKAKIQIKADGTNLDLPTLPLDPNSDITVQLLAADPNNCWESTFSAPFKKNDGEKGKFKAKN